MIGLKRQPWEPRKSPTLAPQPKVAKLLGWGVSHGDTHLVRYQEDMMYMEQSQTGGNLLLTGQGDSKKLQASGLTIHRANSGYTEVVVGGRGWRPSFIHICLPDPLRGTSLRQLLAGLGT